MEKSVLYPYLFLLITLGLGTYFMVDYEKEIETLDKTIEIQACKIDSLFSEIDSLVLELENYDIERQFEKFGNEFLNLLDAIIKVESQGNDDAYAPNEDAVGCLQIRRCMVDDVNRILKRKGATKDQLYTYEDRWERGHSIEMFKIYCEHYNLTTPEDIARCWNGGPRGADKDATVYYWKKVMAELDEPNV